MYLSALPLQPKQPPARIPGFFAPAIAPVSALTPAPIKSASPLQQMITAAQPRIAAQMQASAPRIQYRAYGVNYPSKAEAMSAAIKQLQAKEAATGQKLMLHGEVVRKFVVGGDGTPGIIDFWDVPYKGDPWYKDPTKLAIGTAIAFTGAVLAPVITGAVSAPAAAPGAVGSELATGLTSATAAQTGAGIATAAKVTGGLATVGSALKTGITAAGKYVLPLVGAAAKQGAVLLTQQKIAEKLGPQPAGSFFDSGMPSYAGAGSSFAPASYDGEAAPALQNALPWILGGVAALTLVIIVAKGK